jgi:hypothetical protein
MKLRQYFKSTGIKISWFADQIEYSRSHLSNIMAGRHKPLPRLMKLIEKMTNGKVTAKDFE